MRSMIIFLLDFYQSSYFTGCYRDLEAVTPCFEAMLILQYGLNFFPGSVLVLVKSCKEWPIRLPVLKGWRVGRYRKVISEYCRALR